jgi:hypothetical protein
MRTGRSKTLTLGEKVRVGESGTRTLIGSPAAIVPSMFVTVEFQRGKPAASVSSRQTGCSPLAV